MLVAVTIGIHLTLNYGYIHGSLDLPLIDVIFYYKRDVKFALEKILLIY